MSQNTITLNAGIAKSGRVSCAGSPKTYIHCGIALLIGIMIALFIKPDNGLTSLGVSVLAVTVPTLYLWLTVNTGWCALLFLALLIMTGAMTPTAVWAGSMGHFAVITMIVFSILNYALKETGVIDKIAAWFITRKIADGRPYVFLGLFFLSNLVIGMFVDNLSLAVIYVGIAAALAERIGVKKGDPFYACMFIGILWCNVIISIASPIAHAPVLILIGMMETQLGISVSYAEWLMFGIPFAVIMFAVMMTAAYIWHPDASAFLRCDFEALRRQERERPLDIRGRISAAVFAIAVLAILLPEVSKSLLPAFSSYMSGIGVVVPAILAVCALCLIQTDGRPILDFGKAAQSLPLPAIIFAGVVCVMSTPFSSPETGISTWLGNIIQPVFGSLPPFVIMVLLTAAALVMTNFLSNVVTMVIFFNIGVALLSGGSLYIGAYAAVIGFAASMASLTPSACAPAPLIFGPGHVTVKGVLKANLVFVLLSCIVILALVYPLASAVIGA